MSRILVVTAGFRYKHGEARRKGSQKFFATYNSIRGFPYAGMLCPEFMHDRD
jgi:hypothetical protein